MRIKYTEREIIDNWTCIAGIEDDTTVHKWTKEGRRGEKAEIQSGWDQGYNEVTMDEFREIYKHYETARHLYH